MQTRQSKGFLCQKLRRVDGALIKASHHYKLPLLIAISI